MVERILDIWNLVLVVHGLLDECVLENCPLATGWAKSGLPMTVRKVLITVSKVLMVSLVVVQAHGQGVVDLDLELLMMFVAM